MLRSLLTLLAITSLILTGCARSTGQMWDDTLSCSRHVGRGIASLYGDSVDSKQVRSADDFWNCDEDMLNFNYASMWDEYDSQQVAVSDLESPKSGSLPSIQSFMDPNADPLLSRIFRKLHFDFNSNLVKGKENIEIVQNIADYLKKHPKAYVYVEGHCDKRGPEAYNLALGSRRSNEVKSLLVKEGVEPERVLTVSYGKEHLLAIGNDEPAHRANRRAEFKIYDK